MLTEKEIQQMAAEYGKATVVSGPNGENVPFEALEDVINTYTDGATYANEYVVAAANDYANSTIENPSEHQDAVLATLMDYYSGIIDVVTALRDEVGDKLETFDNYSEGPEDNWEDDGDEPETELPEGDDVDDGE